MATDPWADFEEVGQAPAAPAFPGVIAGRPRQPAPPSQPSDFTVATDARDYEAKQGNQATDNLLQLANSYSKDQAVQSYRVAIGQMDQALNTGDGPQADLALTYAFAKAMDPDSVVREAEQGMVTESQPWFLSRVERAKKEFGMDGAGNYTPEARREIRRQIASSVGSRAKTYDARRAYFSDLAAAAGLDPDKVIGAHDAAPFLADFDRYNRDALGVDTNLAGGVPVGSGENAGVQGGGSPPARDPELRGGLPVGSEVSWDIDAPEDPFDRSQYLQDRYGISPNQESLITAFWNANSGNANLSERQVRDWYSSKGLAVPEQADLDKALASARAGKAFGGINTTAAEREYVRQLDEALAKMRPDTPEDVSGAAGVSAAQGVMMGGLDELQGGVGAVGAAVTGGNPVAAYQAERDIIRREAQRAHEAHPYISTGSEIGGSILTGGAGFQTPMRAGALARTAAAMGNAERAAALRSIAVRSAVGAGAKTGALAGFNYGEGAVGSTVGAGVGALGGATLAGATEIAAPYVGRVIGALRPERPVATAEQTALLEAGARREVPMRQPDIVPEARNARSVLRTSNAGGRIIRDAETQDIDAFEGAIERDLIGGATPARREIMGDNAQEALDRVRETSASRIGEQYQTARQLAGDTAFTPSNAIAEVEAQIAELEAAGPNANRGLIGYLREIRDDLTQGGPVNTGILDAQGRPITRAPGGLSIDAIRTQRTNMRGQITERNLTRTDAERRVGRVLDAASRDIEEGLANNQQALSAFREADNAWRERHQFIKQIMEKVTGPENNRKSGSAAASIIEGWVKGDYRRLRRMWSELDQGERSEIAATVADGLGRNARGDFSFAEFLRHVGNGRGSTLSERSARMIFGDEGMRAINDLRAIARAKVDAGAQTNFSNTGNIVQAGKRGVRNLLLAWLGFGAGDVTGAVVAPAAGSFLSRLGEERAARLMVNPDFTRWLRRVPNTSDPALINRQFARLRSAVSRSPAMLADINALERALVSFANDNTALRSAAAEPGGADTDRKAAN